MKIIVCTPKSLTSAQEEIAIRRAIELNPANAVIARTRRGDIRRLALLIGSRWPKAGVTLSVQFLDNPEPELRTRILAHMNAWKHAANIQFTETNGTGLVRIARLDNPPQMAGYWSYVGTQILGIAPDQPTLNLEGFTIQTPESEFLRVVRHEAGHTLGFEHEHMRSDLVNKIDPKKAIAYFNRTQGWTAAETKQQVLTPLPKKSLIGTKESDPISIMCYQIPAEITKDGKSILGGTDINAKDFAFAATVYPETGTPPPPPPSGSSTGAISSSGEVGLKVPVSPPPPSSTLSAEETLWHRPTAAAEAGSDTFQILIMDEFDSDTGKAASDLQNSHLQDQGGADGKTGTKRATPDTSRRPKFARVLASYGGAQVTGAMQIRSDPGDSATRFGEIISMHERIKKYTNRQSGSLPSDQQMVQFGADLFQTLFQGDVYLLYLKACSRQRSRKLDIVLTSRIPWIADKPWEFAYDPKRQSFLATEDVHMVRNVKTNTPSDIVPPGLGPLRILVVAAQPVGFLPLSVEQEIEVIRRGFDPLIEAGLIQVEVIPRATPDMIHERLSLRTFTVVHFIGHSAFDEVTRKGVLVFEDDHGGRSAIGARSVREVFCKRDVKMIFINSCQSGDGGRWDTEDGIAQTLVSHGLPALVANQYSVLDSSATTFARNFYWALAHGLTIGRATCEARIAVNYSLHGEIIDWAVPVVYTRDPNLTLCLPRSAKATPLAEMRAKSRRTILNRRVRVAVWDIDNVFPSLAQTLEQLNAAQNVFGFQLVPLSVPIDAWDLEERAPDGTPYLWAEKLANRLERTAAQLQADVLTCITGHWLRDDRTRNIYGWWPAERKPPVVIFSCAGFQELTAEGPMINRVIANVLVQILTGFLTGMDTHADGDAKCPMSYNESRDFVHLSGLQKFDAQCRRELEAKIPNELPALEALLQKFQDTMSFK